MSTPILFVSKASDGHLGVSAIENRKKYFSKIGINPKNIVDIVVSHGNKIKTVKLGDGGKYFEGYDGIITKEKRIFLGLTAADCMPVAIFDPVSNSTGLVHCGFRGLDNGVIKNAIDKMKNLLKIDTCKLIIYIGPHICKDHYRIDLAETAKKQLMDAGIIKKNITVDSRCTFVDDSLFSYRKGDLKDRNLYIFGLPH